MHIHRFSRTRLSEQASCLHCTVMASYSSRDLSLVPQITFTFVEEYIKEKTKSSGTKSLGRGFKYYSENYVHGLSVEVKDSRPTINGKCYHSQKKSETPNKMNVTFESVSTANMESASCSCPIGQAGACGHVVGLLYQLAKFKMLDAKAFPEDIARTSQPQSWHEPRGEKIQGKAVQDLTVSGHSSKASSEGQRNIRSTLYNPIRGQKIEWKNHVNELQSAVKDMLIIPALCLERTEYVNCKFGPVPKGSVLSYQQPLDKNCIINLYDESSFPDLPQNNVMSNNYSTALLNEKLVMFDSLSLTKAEISKFETQTRLQSESPLWYKIRKYRLTASNIGEIFKRKKDNKTPVDRLKSTRHVTTSAMRYGLASEPFAASEYAQSLNNEVNLYPCGVVVSFWAPWLAASPDRKVYNPKMDPKFGLLEIKCPMVSSVLEAKYLKKDATGQLKLQRNHSYYYQVLTQLAVTGLQWCDFFVWCQADNHKETIYFNKQTWDTVKDKVDMFYFDDFL